LKEHGTRAEPLEPIDLPIADRAIPGMTGLRLAEEAQRLRPGLPVCLPPAMPIYLPTNAGLELPRLSRPWQQRPLAEQIAALRG
jgi:hypothetical protein